MESYVGVTGVMNNTHVVSLLDVVPQGSRRKLMVGVLASSKTIEGVSNKWPNRYPTPETMGSILEDDPRVLNLIHFNTKDPDLLFEQMIKARSLAGPHCHGFQLNMGWPDPRVLRKFYMMRSGPTIVLQVGSHAFACVKDSPRKLADKIAQEYADYIDCVLLDPSGGLGKPLDTEVLRQYLQALEKKGLDIGLGVAGGLSADTLHLVAPLVDEFPDLCIDAEGRLRDKDDHLDIVAAVAYVKKAFALFRK
ncbi:MAG: hypothetical protein HZA35_03595 [Parcubacteria group bacterium]|nr:hypothetical protein [Parcubacteria group bacterium]